MRFGPVTSNPGTESPRKNTLYRNIYRVTGGLYPMLSRVAPKYVIGSDQLARAMLRIAADGTDLRIVESSELTKLASR